MQKNDIAKALDILNAGGLVAIPTETVYGLGADARNPAALRKIFLAKQRPMNHPLIVHIAHISQLSDWAIDISPEALLLARTFWPGPLTLILKKAPHVHDIVTGGQDTIGIRIPNHPLALAILEQFGAGIAAPSANRFGRISPTTAEAVREELGNEVDYILEGGQCDVGVESTIIDVSDNQPVILRPGMISSTDIENVLHHAITKKKKNAPRVSGSMESHYAPTTKMVLMPTDELKIFLKTHHQNIAFLTWSDLKEFDNTKNNIISISKNPHLYAHDIYQIMRELDKKNLSQIIVENVPKSTEWDAIRDRLERASH